MEEMTHHCDLFSHAICKYIYINLVTSLRSSGEYTILPDFAAPQTLHWEKRFFHDAFSYNCFNFVVFCSPINKVIWSGANSKLIIILLYNADNIEVNDTSSDRNSRTNDIVSGWYTEYLIKAKNVNHHNINSKVFQL